MKNSNKFNIHPLLVLWVMDDDYVKVPKSMSSSSFTNPMRQTILKNYMYRRGIEVPYDISSKVVSRLGQNVHSGAYNAWKRVNKSNKLKNIVNDYIFDDPNKTILINPTKKKLKSTKNHIPIYLEKRRTKKLNGFRITGKFDAIFDGQLIDFKTCKEFLYRKSDHHNKYRIQCSIYAWLFPDLVKQNIAKIIEIYKDHSFGGYKRNSNYSQSPINEVDIELLSPEETENFMMEYLTTVESYKDIDNDLEVPLCTDDDLLRGKSVFKYYASGDTSKRASNVSENLSDIIKVRDKARLAGRRNGVYVEVKGTPKTCSWCPVASVCTQREEMVLNGEIL